MNSGEILKKYFGYDSFREGQQQIVESILAGRDTLGVMPTGAGKSICYQVPALMLPGITLVVSPLISLMQDQVTALVQAGVRAAYINSSLNQGQLNAVMQNARNSVYKLIYVAPERLESEYFVNFAKSADISMITTDEAHCISQWGQDFRPSYLEIPRFAAKLPKKPIMTAFTATATERVREDICGILGLCDPFTLVTGFDRKNLYFEVRQPSDKTADLKSLVKKYSAEDRSGIIYCSTRKNVENLHTILRKEGFSVSRYHAGLPESERTKNQDDFIFDRVKVRIATNAFGMGIDKSNVSYVIHFNMPKDVESYYQEAGRAGRDGSPADCILLYSGQDVITAKFLINKSYEESEQPPEEAETVRQRDLKRLSDMIFYCTGADCLREYILKYFGEQSPAECGNCSYCCSESGREDITVEAQKIMSCIHRAGQRYGMSVICDILRGKSSERLSKNGLDKLSTFGLMTDCTEERLKLICNKLTVMGYIEKTEGQYPVLRLTKKSAPVLKGAEKITTRLPAASGGKSKTVTVYTVNSELLEQLKALRRKIAKVQSMPDYVIFTDMALQDMCRRLPCTEEEFLKISGVGEAKLERYGGDFLDVIRAYVKEKAPEPMTVP
ncbi:MAG: DNA helicase RecQ, partial [Ruminococcus sp.]|nr:DNA helicase RecQ [Ruminococcus sp.]